MVKYNICLLLMFFISCSQIQIKDSTESVFNNAKESLSEGKYNRAKGEFEFVILNSPLSNYASESYFYLGESKFHLEKYAEALLDYEKYLNLPVRDIALSKKSQLMICKSWFNLSNDVLKDQTDTEIAIDKLQYYIEKDSMVDYVYQIESMILALRNKLAEKDYKTALLYLQLNKFDSAIIYFENIINEYYDSDYVYDSIINIALIKAKNSQDEAIDYLLSNKTFFKSQEEHNSAIRLIENK